jgi:hypothetical protein
MLPYSAIPGFSYPFLLGVLGLFFSFGKGILFYAPGMFARVRDRIESAALRKSYGLWLLFAGGLIATYAKWWAWYGGEFWGPRYVFFVTIPASFALALNLGETASVPRALVTLVMLTLSVWIGADGALFGQDNLGQCAANNYALEHLCWHVPEFAAWVRPFIVSPKLTGMQWASLAVYGAVYVWLAAPLALFVVRRAGPALVARLRRGPLAWRAWNF